MNYDKNTSITINIIIVLYNIHYKYIYIDNEFDV